MANVVSAVLDQAGAATSRSASRLRMLVFVQVSRSFHFHSQRRLNNLFRPASRCTQSKSRYPSTYDRQNQFAGCFTIRSPVLGAGFRNKSRGVIVAAASVNHPVPTTDSLIDHIKSKAKIGAVRKVVLALEETEDGLGLWGAAGITPDSRTYQTAIRALLKKDRTDLAVSMYRLRMRARAGRSESLGSDFPLASSVIRAVLRDCKKRKMRSLDSQDIFDELLRDCKVSNVCESENTKLPNDVSKKVSALLSVMNSFLADNDRTRAEQTLLAISMLPINTSTAAVRIDEYNNAIRFLGKSRHVPGVFKILKLMRDSQVQPNDETFEFLANAVVRQVEFVTGAVSMDTLPAPLGAEIAFVGRSNVGKSSLVNMLCNRKALAYVSGRPGKTQQFNFFHVNSRDSESQFYLVDLPGVGYAKVPRPVQEKWTEFMCQYFMFRTSLRLVFHLIDGRHGALEDDELLMKKIAKSGRMRTEYVVVLTKMDKMDKQKVKRSILDKVGSALVRNGCRADTPVVLTSASTRLGRDDMWRHLQFALAYEPSATDATK